MTNFFLIRIGIVIFFFFIQNYNAFSESKQKPNILLIITDQQTAMAMSNTGNPYCTTPAMDRLAANGIRFSRAYAVQPLCMPFRTSLQTGKYPHETGITANTGKGNPNYTLLGKAMSDAGYDVAYHGKWHVAYKGSKNYETFNGDMNDAGVADRAVSFLETDRKIPFFLTASFLNPHDICQLARSLANMPNNRLPSGPIPPFPSVDELPPLPANFNIPNNEPGVIREFQGMDGGKHFPVQEYDETTWRQYLWGYYRMVEKVDREILKVLDALHNTNQEKNTVVIFISDHGDGISAHQWNEKKVLYNESVHIPCVISYMGVSPAGVVDSLHLVSPALDIFPTLLDFTNTAIPSHFTGKSLKPLILGENVPFWRTYVAVETMLAENGKEMGNGRMIQTLNYKYVVYNNKDGALNGEQFFDVKNDPGEMNNLAVDNNYITKINLYKNMLKNWQKKTGDENFTVPDTK